MLQTQDIAYFFLMAAVWTSALAVASPGTGLLELAASVCIVVSAVFAVLLGVNIWALGILAAAFGMFILEIVRPLKGFFLLLSVALFSIGSIFLFRNGTGETTVVYWPLAVIFSVGTLVFFWFVVRKTLQARRQPANNNPSAVIGKVGTAQTEVHQSGSVQVASELWSARSDEPIPAGTSVRVVDREGLVLKVEKES
jgi:membrane-bound serine protease (ClpP class)